MAQSGSITAKVTDYNNLVLYWEVQNQSVEKNLSTIYFELRLTSGQFGAISSSTLKNCSVTIGGYTTEKTVSIDIGNNTYKILSSGTTSTYHNTDGTKTTNIGFTQDFSITFNGTYINSISSSGTAVLPTIARASTLTVTNFVIDKYASIAISRKNSAFRETITATYNGNTQYIESRGNNNSSTTVTWKVPTIYYQLMPNKSSDTVTITCTTYSNSTNGGVVGTSTTTVQMKVDNELCKPLLAPTVKDINETTLALTGDENVLIKHKSTARYDLNGEARNYATLKKSSTPIGNYNSYVTGGQIQNVTYETFNFSVTDSRNLTTTATVTPTYIPYLKPTCNIVVDAPTPATNGKANTKLTINGNLFMGSFGVSNNTYQVLYRWKEKNGEYSEWLLANAVYENNAYSAEVEFENLDYTKAYTFQARAYDRLHTTNSIEYTVRATPVFDWGESDFNFNVPVKINNIEVDYIVEQGEEGIWRYRKWNSGTAELWHTTEPIETTTTTQWGSMYCTDGVFTSKQYPFTFVELPTITVTPQTAQSNYWLFTGGGGSVNYSPAFGIIRPNSATVKAICNYYVIGRWK